MSIDCKVTLPAAARVRDVAKVIAALAGAEMCKQQLDRRRDSWVARPRCGIDIAAADGMAECAWIVLTELPDASLAPTMNGGLRRLYHFEWGQGGERGMILPRLPFWIAAARRLVEFFGGSVDYNDCDAVGNDYSELERCDIHAEDGASWVQLQRRIMKEEPITQAEIDRAEEIIGRTNRRN